MGDTYLTKANIILDFLRFLLAFIDWVFYSLLSVIYQIFFNVSSAEIFSGETIMNFFGRIQLILGVFMLFQLTLTILKGVMDPDSFTDSKSGIGNIVQRVAVSLVLLACIIPINIPNPANEFEKQINNNGLLFGTLYSLQHRIIQNNTLGRLVLGTTDDETANYLTGNDKEQLRKAANLFTTTILRGFIKINLKPDEERVHIEGKEDEMIAENRICSASKFDKFIDIYTDLDSSTNQILGLVHEKCSPNWVGEWFDVLGLDKQYVFVYNGFISTIVAVVFIFIFLSLTIDVAVRALKLALLRLISPIPIISYMDPKGGKDGAFNSWVKLMTTTYLDLFIRLAIIYFILFLIQDMIVHGIIINTTGGIVGGLSVIIIWIAMFMFAKQAPKFIQEALGIKGGSFSLFGGLASVVGGIGSAISSAKASYRAAKTNDPGSEKSLLNRGKQLLAGITGGISGLSAGYEVASGKDGSAAKVIEAMNKRNYETITRGEAGSTAVGRGLTQLQRMFTGEDAYDIKTKEINKNKAIEKAGKDYHAYLEDRAKKKGGQYYLKYSGNGISFDVSDKLTLDDWINAREVAKQQGKASFTFNGQQIDTYGSIANAIEGDLIAAAGYKWASIESSKDLKDQDVTFVKLRDTASDSGVFEGLSAADQIDPNKIKSIFKGAGNEVKKIEASKEYQKNKADHGATGGKS